MPDEVKPEGIWPEFCLQRAFVKGAEWWEWRKSNATMWSSDRKEAEIAAIRVYGEPGDERNPDVLTRENGKAFKKADWVVNWTQFQIAREYGVILVKTRENWLAINYANGQTLLIGTIQWVESELKKMNAPIVFKFPPLDSYLETIEKATGSRFMEPNS